MTITWDDNKNESNFTKHGVWFEEVMNLFFDANTLSNLNEHPDGDRYEYLGHSSKQKLVYVVTVEKGDDEIRIISARLASTRERSCYEEGI